MSEFRLQKMVAFTAVTRRELDYVVRGYHIYKDNWEGALIEVNTVTGGQVHNAPDPAWTQSPFWVPCLHCRISALVEHTRGGGTGIAWCFK